MESVLEIAKAKVKAMSDEVLMETVYMGEQQRVDIALYAEACDELEERGLAGEQYCAFVKWYEEEFES